MQKYKKYKKRKKFNAIIIGKSHLFSAVAVLLFAAAIFFYAFSSFELPEKYLVSIIGNVIPSARNSVQESIASTVKNKFLSAFDTEKVLAQAIPMLNNAPLNVNLENETPKSENSQNKKDLPLPQPLSIPENTFPISNSQIIGRNLEVRNETTYQPDFEALLYAPLQFKSPEILIVHTHASESYKKDELNYYVDGESDRTTDTNLNVVRVGAELCTELTKYGFKVTHAKDINDHPSYNKSYTKTLEVINRHLQSNGNIQIVIDLHRDSIVKSDGTKLKFTAAVNGENVSQVMLVCGTNQAGLDNDTWQENLKFAMKLQNYMENTYPGFARPLNLRQERFNTHATRGSLIIEVGTSGNTLDESIASAKYLAKAISHVLKPYI